MSPDDLKSPPIRAARPTALAGTGLSAPVSALSEILVVPRGASRSQVALTDVLRSETEAVRVMTADLGGPSAIRYRNSVAEGPHRAWTVVLPQHARAAAVARHSAGEVLRAWNLGHLEPVALLVISELVTNAIVHAHANGASPELHLHAGNTWLRIEVHDADPRPPQPRTPGSLDEAGRGLLLIEAITDQWGVYGAATGKAVWAILQLSR